MSHLSRPPLSRTIKSSSSFPLGNTPFEDPSKPATSPESSRGSIRLPSPVSSTSDYHTHSQTPKRPLAPPGYFTPQTNTPSKLRDTSNVPSAIVSPSDWRTTFTSRAESPAYSSDYLTPPEPLQTPDIEKPPYKAGRRSSRTLAVVQNIENMKLPALEKNKYRKFRVCPNTHWVAAQEPWNAMSWRLPRCQIAPTAPKRYQSLCTKRVEIPLLNRSSLANLDMTGRKIPPGRASWMPSRIKRRWSSVELGTHRITGNAPFDLQYNSNLSNYGGCSHQYRLRYRNFRSRSDYDDRRLVKTICDRLRLRKVPSSVIRLPTTITLQRAGDNDAQGNIDSMAMNSSTVNTTPLIGSTKSASENMKKGARSAQSEYLISDEDIDFVANIIGKSLIKSFPLLLDSSEYTMPESRSSRITSVTSKGVIPPKGLPAESTLTSVEAHSFSEKVTRLSEDSLYPTNSPSGREVRLDVKRSPHEIVWSPGDPEMDRHSKLLKVEETPIDLSPKLPIHQKNELQKSPAFDPSNAKASIHQWSWDVPGVPLISQENVEGLLIEEGRPITPTTLLFDNIKPRLVVRRAHSDSNSNQNVSHLLPNLRTHRSESVIDSVPPLEDVVSFPPLPRKMTSDWIKPLPDLGSVESKDMLGSFSSSHGLPSTQSSISRLVPLYDQGIDATIVRNESVSSFSSSRKASIALKSRMSLPQVDTSPQYEMKRNKSIAIPHPVAPPRIGSQSSIGSSIGCSSRIRRMSKHLSTIDNKNRPSSKSTTWSKARADSVFPLVPPSPPASEVSPEGVPGQDVIDSDYLTIPPRSSEKRIAAQVASTRKSYGPTKSSDLIGIFDSLNGVRRVPQARPQSETLSSARSCYDHEHTSCQPAVDWIG